MSIYPRPYQSKKLKQFPKTKLKPDFNEAEARKHIEKICDRQRAALEEFLASMKDKP